MKPGVRPNGSAGSTGMPSGAAASAAASSHRIASVPSESAPCCSVEPSGTSTRSSRSQVGLDLLPVGVPEPHAGTRAIRSRAVIAWPCISSASQIAATTGAIRAVPSSVSRW